MSRTLLRLLPAGFRGQVAGILLLGLLLSQLLAVALYGVLLPAWQKELRPVEVVAKLEVTLRLLESVPEADRAEFASRLDEQRFRIAYLPAAAPERPAADELAAEAALRLQIARELSRSPEQIRVSAVADADSTDAKRIALPVRGGGLLTVVAPISRGHRLAFVEQAAIVAFFVFALGGLWAWLTWTVNAPLMRFAQAAERVGLDVQAPPFPEQGPAQLRRAIRAFNQMQVRLQRMLGDRTLMLGAISHDLRTPLTRIRLRIETGRTEDERARMLADIELLESMLTSTMSFVRGVDDAEPQEAVDLDLALQTVCDLISDVGGNVSYQGPSRCRYQCRPQAMMRALANVVSNAAKYGPQAHVVLSHVAGSGFLIEVTDDGPGIAPDEMSKVFEPFYRTAAARERDSEGMGLGLSIARSIILAHGGSIELSAAQPHGLVVRIMLPAVPGP